MATQTTGGGSTTSFTNTPQAKDDTYPYIEDVLRSERTLYNSCDEHHLPDVMSQRSWRKRQDAVLCLRWRRQRAHVDFELLVKDVNAAGASPWEETLNHNWVRINNGKIEYRIADGSGDSGPGPQRRFADRRPEFRRPVRLRHPARQRHAQRSRRQDQHHRRAGHRVDRGQRPTRIRRDRSRRRRQRASG